MIIYSDKRSSTGSKPKQPRTLWFLFLPIWIVSLVGVEFLVPYAAIQYVFVAVVIVAAGCGLIGTWRSDK